jgi:hypothetical protein
VSEAGRCFTCWFSDWEFGGYCLRPNAGFTRRQEVDKTDLHKFPSIRRLDFCGDHRTLREIKRDWTAHSVKNAFEEDLPIPDMILDGTILGLLLKRKELL